MRKILFRGQTRVHGERVNVFGQPQPGKWVYGGIFPAPENGDFAVIYQTEPQVEKFTVYAETVGQFTGLVDKDGQMIFEGDVVSDAIGNKYTVEWAEGWFGFQMVSGNEHVTFCSDDTGQCHALKVIGNIFDPAEQ